MEPVILKLQKQVLDFSIDLRSMTAARGSFSMEFERYDEVPKELTEKIIEKAQKKKKNNTHNHK